MMFYSIDSFLRECDEIEVLNGAKKYVIVLNGEQWEHYKDRLNMGIELPIELDNVTETKIEVNYDSLTGTFCVPKQLKVEEDYATFGFAMDERGIVFIDDNGFTKDYLSYIQKTKKWKVPSLERFIFDFLESIVKDDSKILSDFEERLNEIETEIIRNENNSGCIISINDIRGELLDIRNHYEQLIDFAQELEENENDFFAEDNLRYFHLFSVRVERLQNKLTNLRDYSVQLRELYQSKMDVKQNQNMAILTILTTLFFPLSIITGWYGMNFVHMPELKWEIAYPLLMGICALIVIMEIIIFKKKKYF